MERLVAHWEKPIPSLREACSEVSAALESIFMKMVAKKPDDRYQSMTEVITDLERCRMAEAAAASHPLSSREDREEDRELDDFLQVVAGEEADREAKGARQSLAERTSTAEQQAASSDTRSSNGSSVTSSQRQQARRDAAADRRSRRHPPRKRRSFARFVRLTTGSITAAGLLVAVIAFWPEESGGNRPISRPSPPAPASDISPGGLPPLVGGPDALQLAQRSERLAAD